MVTGIDYVNDVTPLRILRSSQITVTSLSGASNVVIFTYSCIHIEAAVLDLLLVQMVECV